jgi:hypothetical protein
MADPIPGARPCIVPGVNCGHLLRKLEEFKAAMLALPVM